MSKRKKKALFLSLIEKTVRRVKNPEFRFDENITGKILFHLTRQQFFLRARAFYLIVRGRYISGLSLGHNVSFRNFHLIAIANGVRISEGVVLDGLGEGGLFLGARSSIGAYSRLIVSTTYFELGRSIHIGSDVAIGEFSYIGGAGGVVIGEGCIIGQYFSVHPENHCIDSIDMDIRHQGVTRKGIRIGRNVWVGSKVTILDDVEIGEGCIIAAGSVVTKGKFPDNCIIGGIPARILRNR